MSTNSFRRLRFALVVSTALVAFGMTPQVFGGVQDNGQFELGNDTGTPAQGSADILGSGAQPGPDWDDLFNGNHSLKTPNDATHTAVFLDDGISAGGLIEDTVYSGGPGDKNSDIVEDWTWGSSSVPVKDDIGNAYAYAITDPVTGHLIIYVGAERLSNNGDSHIDVEFFQSQVGLDRVPPCPDGKCKFTGSNTDGDLLANMDFTNGGGFAGLTIRERDSTKPNNYKVIETLNAEGCNSGTGGDPNPAGSVCAFVNGGTINGGGWDNFDSHGAVVATIPQNGFTEWGVDVTELFDRNDLCFSAVQVKTRSSQSFTATLKDFVIRPFQACIAKVTTKVINNATGGTVASDDPFISTTVTSGTVVHDTVSVVPALGSSGTPTGTVVFTRYDDIACGTRGGTAHPEAAVPLVNGAASSQDYTTTGDDPEQSYQAVYTSDSTSFKSGKSGCEPFKVAKGDVTITTDIRNAKGSVMNGIIQNGDTIHDLATLTGTQPVPGQPGKFFDPTGTVTFTLFTTSANCTGASTTSTGSLSGGASTTDGLATAESDPFIPNAAAGSTLSYTAVYGGDSNYNGSTISKCEPTCAIPFLLSQ